MSFTDKQLMKYLTEEPEFDEENYDDQYDEWYERVDEFFYEGGDLPGFGSFEQVASWNYGDGHERGAVFKHESGRYFQATGSYSSWDSSTWDKVEEVEPYEVTKIRYRRINNDN